MISRFGSFAELLKEATAGQCFIWEFATAPAEAWLPTLDEQLSGFAWQQTKATLAPCSVWAFLPETAVVWLVTSRKRLQ